MKSLKDIDVWDVCDGLIILASLGFVLLALVLVFGP